MPPPMIWESKLGDGVSGVATTMGAKLDALAGKFSKLGTVAAGTDSQMRLGQDKQLTDLASKLAKLRAAPEEQRKAAKAAEEAGLAAIEAKLRAARAQADKSGAAAAAFREATALEAVKQKALEAAKAMDRLRAASRAAASSPMVNPNKTGANSGGVFGQTKGAQSGVGRLAQVAGDMFGARGAQAVLGTARALDTLNGALTKTRFGVTSLSSVGKGALSVLGSIAMAAAAAAAAVAAMGIGLGLAGAKYIANLHSFKSSMTFALNANLKSAAQGAEAWRIIQKLAIGTGNDLQQTAGAFNGLLAGGFKLGEAEELMRVLADMKTLDPSANLEGIALAIKQIKMTGKLQGDELNQLGNAVSVDAVYEELAKKLGKSKAEIIKMKEAGKITADDAIDAIKKATLNKTGMKAGGLAEAAASKTMVGNLMKAKAVLDSFLSGLNIDFSPVARFLTRVQTVLGGDAGKRFGKGIEGVFQSLVDGLDGMTEKDIAAMFDTASGMLEGVATAIRDISSGIRTVDGWMTKVNDKASAWGVLMNVAMMGINGAALGIQLLLAPFYGIKSLVEIIAAKIQEWTGGIQAAGAAMSSFGGAGFMEGVVAKATGSNLAAGAPGAAAASAPVTKNITQTVSVTANGLTFADFEARVAEIVRREMAAGADAP